MGNRVTAALFAGRRGRLLAGLLLAEFAGALQSVAYSSVLPLASAELDGGSLYGATVAATALTTILVLSAGPRLLTRFSATHTLVIATVFYVIGVLLAATAPAMGFVLAGSIVRGFASGLLTGFALTAVGALYDEEVRPRVVGLFAVMWVLPALLGPPLNSAIAVAFGWRWAMAWPAVLVVAARILVGRQAEIVPWHRSKQTSELGNGSLVLCGLVIASCASAVNAAWAIAPFVLGLLLAAWASRRTLRGLLGDSPQSLRSTTTFLTLCLAFFGGAALVALGEIGRAHV